MILNREKVYYIITRLLFVFFFPIHLFDVLSGTRVLMNGSIFTFIVIYLTRGAYWMFSPYVFYNLFFYNNMGVIRGGKIISFFKFIILYILIMYMENRHASMFFPIAFYFHGSGNELQKYNKQINQKRYLFWRLFSKIVLILLNSHNKLLLAYSILYTFYYETIFSI